MGADPLPIYRLTARRTFPNPARAALILLILAGSAARLAPLTANRFHPDEALFATLARLIASGQDTLLAHTTLLVDKPPLFYYSLALAVISFGAREIALRMPGELMSLISVALTARLAWRLWRSWPATLIATAIAALSPFTILFSPTVFSDPQYVFWLMSALVAAAERRWGWAGLLGGLALASKQSAAFFLPLVVLIGLSRENLTGSWRRSLLPGLIRIAAGFGLILVAITVWDRLRAPAPSFWTAAVDANNPGRLVRSDEVWPRASAWLSWASVIGGLPALDLGLAGLAMCAAPLDAIRHRQSRRAAATLLITAALLAYGAVLWFVAFPLLDRYLLPAVYLVALLAGRGADLLLEIVRERTQRVLVRRALAPAALIGLVVAFAPGSIRAAGSGYPVGGDHGAYAGIDRAAAYLSARPWGTVVYSHDLAWPLDFYLFDAYVYRAYFLAPGPLANDLRAFGGSHDERYVILSGTESVEEIAQAAGSAGFRLTPIPLGDGSPLKFYRLDRVP